MPMASKLIPSVSHATLGGRFRRSSRSAAFALDLEILVSVAHGLTAVHVPLRETTPTGFAPTTYFPEILPHAI